MPAEATAREETLTVLSVCNAYGVILLQAVYSLGRERHRGSLTRTDVEQIQTPQLLERRLAELVPLLWPRVSIPVPAVRSAA
jgi:hypothetical protein